MHKKVSGNTYDSLKMTTSLIKKKLCFELVDFFLTFFFFSLLNSYKQKEVGCVSSFGLQNLSSEMTNQSAGRCLSLFLKASV